MLATVANTYTWLPVIIMLIAGVLGGAINNFLAASSGANTTKLTLRQSVVIGIGAALLVPLFLNMISSSLLSDVVGAPDKPGDFSKALVFLGFCLVAAISSRAFIQKISDQLLNQLKQTATEAKKTADEAKQEAQDAQTKANVVVTTEPEQPENASLAIDPDEQKILKAFAARNWVLRSRTGLANDAEINPAEIDNLLRKLEEKQLIGQTKSSTGERWYITPAGHNARESQ